MRKPIDGSVTLLKRELSSAIDGLDVSCEYLMLISHLEKGQRENAGSYIGKAIL